MSKHWAVALLFGLSVSIGVSAADNGSDTKKPATIKAVAKPAAKSVAKPAAKAFALAPGAEQMLSHGRFEGIAMYAPKQQVKSFVLLFSSAEGWQAGDAETARLLAARGALVAGIDTARLYAGFEVADDPCLILSGDVENLSRYLQAYYKLATYFPPIVIGEGNGGTLAYMLAAQAPDDTLSGAISLGFCPQTKLRKTFCKGEGLRYARGKANILKPAADLHTMWTWVDAGANPDGCGVKIDRDFPDVDHAQRIVSSAHNRQRLLLESYDRTAATLAPLLNAPKPALLADLPIVEIPASGKDDVFAILISGDGGWAGLDKEVGAALKARGVPVAGLDSLRYFWTERTPSGVARDVERMIQHYASHWDKSKVILIGYSQGANVMPFVLNRLTPAARARVSASVLMGLGERADVEFHLSNWVASSDDGLPIPPEIAKLSGGNPVCIYGEKDEESACPSLDPKKVHIIKLPGGHHFDGNFDNLARLIVEAGDPPR